MIDITTNKTVRETTATWEYMDGDKLETAQIRVRYFSYTIQQLKEQRQDFMRRKEETPDAIVWLSETLSTKIEALPDLAANGKPVVISEEFLAAQTVRNLESIQKAIEADENPQKKHTSSSLPVK